MMQLLARLLAIYYLAAVLWFILGLRTFLSVRRKFRKELTDEQRDKYKANDRLDFDLTDSDFAWLCVGGLTVYPLRLPLLFAVAVSNVLVLQIFAGKCTLDVTLQDFDEVMQRKASVRVLRDQKRQQWFMKTLRVLVVLHCWLESWFLGVWTIREWKVLNTDFDFDQNDKDALLLEPLDPEDRQKQYSTKTFVSNHISIVDTLFFITKLYPSFLAKSSLFDHPLIGPCARSLNCVFLNRQSREDRERTIKVLGARQNEIWKLSVEEYLNGNGNVRVSDELKKFIEFERTLSSDDAPPLEPASRFTRQTPPLFVFPEGTTSCGKHIIPLKRGAFIGLRPVSPVVLIYRCPQFALSYDIMPLIWTLPLMLANLRPTTLDVYWLRECLPPAPWTGDAGERTGLFCKEVRKRMSRVLLAEAHWPMPAANYPDAWEGSMQSKMECIEVLFNSSRAEKRAA